MPRPRATCIGAPPARTSSTPRWCSSCAPAIDALIADLDRAIDGFTDARRPPSPHRRGRRAPGCSTRCRCRSGSSSRAMRRRWRARASGCGGCGGRRWCCNSAAPPARWPRSASAASTSPSGLPRCSTCRCRTRPGTAIATGWPRSRRAFAILAGTCGKIARDVSLLMQTEVGEAFEPAAPGRGGSSTMPHKRNPTAAAAALAAATIAPNLLATILAAQVQEHERALGGWQAEWPTFPALALVTSGALAAVVDIAEGLEVDAERMRANLDVSARADHGRSGGVRARRQARQARGAQDRRGGEPQGASPPSAICRTCSPRTIAVTRS